MRQTEGIIFSDLFITNKKLFVEFFTQYYESNYYELEAIIQELKRVLNDYTSQEVTEKMAIEFKNAWKDFQKYVLLNEQDLELIIAYRDNHGKNAQFSKIVTQKDVEGQRTLTYKNKSFNKYGIDAGHELIKESMSAIKAKKVQNFLSKHLNDFLNQLEQKIEPYEAKLLHQYHNEFLLNDYKNRKKHLTGTLWRIPFYGENAGHYYGGQGLGQAYDAFMNHLANYNREVYDYLRTGGISNKKTVLKTNVKKTVYNEEGGVKQSGNFPKLLNDSKNHTGWYTGGDIIIVDPSTMSIVYNIQLKTTRANQPSVFGEKVQKIRVFINNFYQLSTKEKGEALFDFMLTSISNTNDFNNVPQNTADKIIIDQLSNNTGLFINLTE